jgi:hypothetical protein
VTERFNVCAAPEVTAVDTEKETVRPCCTNARAGLTEIEKSDGGAAVTVSATVVAWVPVLAEPVTVMLEIEAGALAEAVAVIVELCPEDTDAGLNETVTPGGRADADRETNSALPEVMAVAMVATAKPPAANEMLAGLAEIEKSVGGAAITVSETVVACVPVVAEPVTVTLEIEAAALAAAVTVIVELCPEDTEAGVNDTVTPTGRPVADREMDSALPVTTAVEMVTVPLDPACTVSAAGDAETEKSLGGGLPTMQSWAEFENSFWTV